MRRYAFLLRPSTLGVVLALLSSMTISCGKPPTAPVEEGVRFLFVEGRTVVGVGETSLLKAFEMRTGHETSDATARTRWSVSNPAVATVQQTTVRGINPGSTIVSAIARGPDGTADVHVVTPAPAPQEVIGRFAGTLTFTECVRLAGEGPNLCRDRVGGVFPFELDIVEQIGARVRATLKIMASAAGIVVGYVDAAQRLNLSGTLGIAGEALSVLIRKLELTLEGSRLTGSATLDYAVITGFGPQLVKQAFTVDARRSP